MSEPTLNEQAKEWLKVSAHPNWCMRLLAANEQCDCGLQLVIDLEAKLSKMERRIEIALNAVMRAQPATHELDGAIVIWEVAWNELQEALAGGDDGMAVR